ncbi:TIGR00303 family protein [Candidatus Geothermarchaeota archaeon ex4572_27]|nr:MAG: TIGR00303 family protein [Candidatus Geothermarchaeota archaeon ex4572_27]
MVHEEGRGEGLLRSLAGRRPLFICVIGSTETSTIEGITAAGASPRLTLYTPAADVEYLLLGRCICIPSIPITPEGIPTPALITRASLKLADIPALVVDAGSYVKPSVPYVDVGGAYGRDIRTGSAMDYGRVVESYRRSVQLGRELSKLCDYLVIGESIPAGTTTALATLMALGVDAEGKVSSAMPSNPHGLKSRVAREAIDRAGLARGAVDDPLLVVSRVGDPMMPCFAGLIVGAADRVPVVMAGGTQMAAVAAIVRLLREDALENVVVGTTRWIVEDRSSDIKGLIGQVARIPIAAALLDFSRSMVEGLRRYEEGYVKEGVGAGGASIAAILASKGAIGSEAILRRVEEDYASLKSRGYAE